MQASTHGFVSDILSRVIHVLSIRGDALSRHGLLKLGVAGIRDQPNKYGYGASYGLLSTPYSTF